MHFSGRTRLPGAAREAGAVRWISQYLEFSWLAGGVRGDTGFHSMNPDWARLFPETDYRPAMNLRVIDGPGFFVTRDRAILEIRRELLKTAPQFYRAGTPDTKSLARFLKLPAGDCCGLIEPDWVLLQPNEKGEFVVEGGCVCFPTMWSLPEKIGLPLSAVHGPVPGLNAALGAKIDHFLSRLSPDTSYGRENWGLSASSALDQHPRHHLPEIDLAARLDQIWLRIEEQALARLDDGKIVFGICIHNLRLDQLPNTEIASRLAHALRTMPNEMAAYKRLTNIRESVAAQLVSA